MKLEGTYRIAAPVQVVWAKLMDPEVLRRAMPGCEQLEATGDNRYRALIKTGVGPVKGIFNGEVALSDIFPERSYTLTTSTKSKVGFAEGTGRIELEPAGADTLVRFTGEVKIGGMLASVGGRLVETAAKKNIRDTFANLARECGAVATA